MLSKGILQMLLATVFFALMQVCVKLIPDIPAFQIVFVRCLISLVITVAMLRHLNIPLFGNNKKWLLLRGIFGITALTLYFNVLQNMPLASAVTIQYLSPILTTVFAIWILGEKVRHIQWLFFGLAFAGVLLIKGFDPRIELKYFIFGMLSAAFSALAYNCVRKLKDTDHPLVVVLYFPMIGIPVTGIITLFNWQWPTAKEWMFLGLIGLFTQVAQVLMTRALQNEVIAKISAVRYLGIVYALAFGYFIFEETYGLLALSGIALVLAGVLLSLRFKTARTS